MLMNVKQDNSRTYIIHDTIDTYLHENVQIIYYNFSINPIFRKKLTIIYSLLIYVSILSNYTDFDVFFFDPLNMITISVT